MRTRLLIAAASLAIATAASAAEPAKPEARPTAQPTDKPAQVVLASADQVRTPAPGAEVQVATPAKRPRAARTTTCRCANQTER